MRLAKHVLFTWMALALLAPSARAFDGGAWSLGKGEWYSEVRGGRGSANAFFLEDGRDAPLPGSGRTQSFSLTSYNEIGWKKNLSFTVNLPFESNQTRTGGETESVTGLSDLLLGVRLRLKDTMPGLVLDGGWKAPLGYEKDLQPTLGNGRQELFAAAHIGVELPWINGFAQAARGFRFVGEVGDVRVATSADLAGWVGERVLLGARYADEGVWASTSPIEGAPHSYAAGPVVLVRMDERVDLSGGSFYRWAGRNVDKTLEVYVAVSFRQTKLSRLQGFLGTSKLQ